MDIPPELRVIIRAYCAPTARLALSLTCKRERDEAGTHVFVWSTRPGFRINFKPPPLYEEIKVGEGVVVSALRSHWRIDVQILAGAIAEHFTRGGMRTRPPAMPIPEGPWWPPRLPLVNDAILEDNSELLDKLACTRHLMDFIWEWTQDYAPGANVFAWLRSIGCRKPVPTHLFELFPVVGDRLLAAVDGADDLSNFVTWTFESYQIERVLWLKTKVARLSAMLCPHPLCTRPRCTGGACSRHSVTMS